jgi:preprotein translocase subunit SecG
VLETLVTVLHITVCVFLIIIVLLQHGKGADIGAALGGSTQTVFGAGGAATFLHKLTIGAAVTFMLTSIFLSTMASRQSAETIMEGAASDAGKTKVEDKADPAAKNVEDQKGVVQDKKEAKPEEKAPTATTKDQKEPTPEKK